MLRVETNLNKSALPYAEDGLKPIRRDFLYCAKFNKETTNPDAQRIWRLINKKMSSEESDKVKESVKNYYGKRLKTSDDLQSNRHSNASKIDEYSGIRLQT